MIELKSVLYAHFLKSKLRDMAATKLALDGDSIERVAGTVLVALKWFGRDAASLQSLEQMLTYIAIQ